MFAGCFLYGLTNGLDFRQCGELASRAASKLVTQYGPRLDAETLKAMLKDLR